MLEKQSLGDFVTRINSGKAVIVYVSPQSRPSLAAFFGLSQSQSKSVDFMTLEESPLERLLTNVDDDGHLYGVSGGSWGIIEDSVDRTVLVASEQDSDILGENEQAQLK
ncbi:hypothetical protein GUJ93_ZPchr0013g35876 [Zizania palustris]|uniref:Uncharacterized protein n=1 Tax=Zizania palustris TaxID=103762 RepID=A0A8J5X550_ZIZPA|nr:hypothetical protein GUJ93_ZPchr0013g35876 [Zizania palustris]